MVRERELFSFLLRIWAINSKRTAIVLELSEHRLQGPVVVHECHVLEVQRSYY
jgi:hypothetical protein